MVLQATTARLRGRVFPAPLVKARPSIESPAPRPIMRGKSMFKLPSAGRSSSSSVHPSRRNSKPKSNDGAVVRFRTSVDMDEEA